MALNNKKLVSFRLHPAAAVEIEPFLTYIRRRTGLDIDFSSLMRHSINFALKHQGEAGAERV